MHSLLRDAWPAERAKLSLAAEAYRLETVTDPDGRLFDAAYALLGSFFAPRGELEDRGALEGFVRSPVLSFGPGLEGHYRLIVAFAGEHLVGVRDCYIDLDRRAGVCVVALSHSLIVPEHRRTGLAALLRLWPVALAREIVAERLGEDDVPLLAAAEMEPVHPRDPDTRTRLWAYGAAGFSVIDPFRLPYAMPDFRDAAQLVGRPLAIPLLSVVRLLGRGAPGDGVAATTLPFEVAAAFPRLFHACHRLYLPASRVDPLEVHALRALCRSSEPVPLLPLPRAPGESSLLDALTRERVFPAYAAEFVGKA